MEEVVGSIPTRSTKSPNTLDGVNRPVPPEFAQGFCSGWFFLPWFSLPVATMPSLRDFASETDVCVVIIVLSEARGLSLFLAIEDISPTARNT